jgi:hypothetical protein
MFRSLWLYLKFKQTFNLCNTFYSETHTTVWRRAGTQHCHSVAALNTWEVPPLEEETGTAEKNMTQSSSAKSVTGMCENTTVYNKVWLWTSNLSLSSSTVLQKVWVTQIRHVWTLLHPNHTWRTSPLHITYSLCTRNVHGINFLVNRFYKLLNHFWIWLIITFFNSVSPMW